MIAAVATIAAALVGGVLAYLLDRVQQRRAMSADALIETILDSSRSQFHIDLSAEDHALLITRPLEGWESLLQRIDAGVAPEDRAKKVEELLTWRVQEREARIKFAVTAQDRQLKGLAKYHLTLNDLAVAHGFKRYGDLEIGYVRTVETLIDTIEAIRHLPIWQKVAREHRARSAKDRRDAIRVLVADFSESRPPFVSDWTPDPRLLHNIAPDGSNL